MRHGEQANIETNGRLREHFMPVRWSNQACMIACIRPVVFLSDELSSLD
jgi:hypothetical protein